MWYDPIIMTTATPITPGVAADIAAYHAALNSGDMATALRLANEIDWVAAAPKIAAEPLVIPSFNFSAAPKGVDYEKLILARDEHRHMGF